MTIKTHLARGLPELAVPWYAERFPAAHLLVVDGVVLPCCAHPHMTDTGPCFRIEDEGVDVDSGTGEGPGVESAEVILLHPAKELDGVSATMVMAVAMST